MKAKAIQFSGPRQLEIVEETLPEVGEGQIRIKSAYSGISHGTEMNVYRGDAPMWTMQQDPETRLFIETEEPQWQYPLKYGYCCVGHVTETGTEVTALAPGDPVFCFAPHQTENVLSARSVLPLTKEVELKTGVLVANLSTTFNGLLDADVHLNECVVVFGQGVLGQLAVQWAKMSGASPVVAVDLIDKRLEISKQVSGADVTLNPNQVGDVAMEVRKMTENRGADIVYELSASDRALHEAIRTACYNGKVIVMSWYPGTLSNVALGAEFHHNRIQLICSQTGGTRPALSHRWNMQRRLRSVVELMPQLNLEPLITDVVSFDHAARAYELIDRHPEDTLQVVFQY